MLYIAIGILGATVMPHNLYLHSAIVQTRESTGDAGKREAIRFATIDSTVALMLALFINAAILILAAAAFHTSGQHRRRRNRGRLSAAVADARRRRCEHVVRGGAARLGAEFDDDGDARRPDRDGGLPRLRLPPWLRRLITRPVAIVPAVIVAGIYGEGGTASCWCSARSS